MKEFFVILTLVTVAFSVRANTDNDTLLAKAAKQYIDYTKPYESLFLSYFDPKIDETWDGSQGSIYLETDGNDHFWIRYENPGYHISKDNHMYLKLVNGDIIILTCISFQYHMGYYNYESYFLMDSTMIEQMITSDVIKVRVESDRGVTDDILLNEEHNKDHKYRWYFKEAYQIVKVNAYLKHKKELKQQELNNNPLSGF